MKYLPFLEDINRDVAYEEVKNGLYLQIDSHILSDNTQEDFENDPSLRSALGISEEEFKRQLELKALYAKKELETQLELKVLYAEKYNLAIISNAKQASYKKAFELHEQVFNILNL